MTKGRVICIGTHHKTGTVWMRKVWRAISADQDIPFAQCYRAERLNDIPDEGPFILVNWSSGFPREVFERDDTRFIHIIRDPRDVLLSGMRYHRVAPLGNEKFLRKPREEWGGMTYQEKINSLVDDHDRLLFEMANKHTTTVKEMLKWPKGHPRALDVRYEDLIEDRDCSYFRHLLRECDIDGLHVPRAVKEYWNNSLFGGLADEKKRSERQNIHVSSGKKRQWERKLPREVAEVYAQHFQRALEALGYEKDDGWVERCLPGDKIAA